MRKIFSLIKDIWHRRKTKISYLAILHEVTYDTTIAIKALAKLERATVGMLREIGRLVPYPELFLEEVEPEKGNQ